MKVVHLTIKNRAVAILVAILILALGVTFLTVGVALLAAVAATGIVIGSGAALYRRLRGKPDIPPSQRLSSEGRVDLDPSLEVRPSRPATIEPPRNPDK